MRRVAWVVTTVWLSWPASGLATFDLDTHQPPTEDGRPVEVEIGVFVVDLLKFDSMEQLVTADVIVTARWRDPKLAHAAGRPPPRLERTIWTPNLQIVNAAAVTQRSVNVHSIAPDGTIAMGHRFFGTFTNPADLHAFPFDRQAIGITVVSADPPEHVTIRVFADRSGQGERLSAPGWIFEQGAARPTSYRIAPANRQLSGVAFVIPATREAGYYIWKIVLPAVIVVVMSWAVFWVKCSETGLQIGITTTSMLTLIAYRFMLGQYVPSVSYLTRMDVFILGSTMTVFVGFLAVVIAAVLGYRGNEARCQSILRWCRSLVPTAFLIALLVAFAME